MKALKLTSMLSYICIMSTFKDHFSGHASEYKKYRPQYPQELFGFLSSICPQHESAWDVGTGNGQAAVALTNYFEYVLATDASHNQVAGAMPHERVDYKVSPAEKCPIEQEKFDLVTVAQAAHWFDLDPFYCEVRSVAKNNAVLAIWTYGLFSVNEQVDEIVNAFYHDVVGPYWPPERRHVEQGYSDLEFPFEIIESPKFTTSLNYTLDQLLGYVETWSAVKNYKIQIKVNPIQQLRAPLAEVWGPADKVNLISWPIALKVGRVIHSME